MHRATKKEVEPKEEGKRPKEWKPPARSTIHHEIVTLRQVLKTAMRHGWLNAMPDLSLPYKSAGKISHRAWFSPDEYKRLYEATRERANNPKTARWEWTSEQMHDFVLFMANTGLRPDEARRLQFRDVEIVKDDATKETILEIEVRGKRGVGYCKSTTGAVKPFIRLKERMRTVIVETKKRGKRGNLAASVPEQSGKTTATQAKKANLDGNSATTIKEELRSPEPTDLVFPGEHRELFNQLLDELELKFDRDGNRRTAYSLRHTYICLRLMEGADIYAIAKNCRTSVEMIEKFYASHIKNTLDAAAINIRRPRKGNNPPEKHVDE
jgi:integrase